jgi:hypothetical protein
MRKNAKEKNRCTQKRFLISLLEVTSRDRLYNEEIKTDLKL